MNIFVRKQLRILQHLTILAVTTFLFAGNTSAALLDAFTNGGFEGYTGNKDSFNGNASPGWTVTDGSPDIFNASTTMSDFAWQSSSTGGDFLHGIGWDGRPSSQGGPYVESALQVGLTGLITGQQYEISFEQSISNSVWSEGGGYWEVVFGSQSLNSALMALPGFGVVADWVWQTLIFTATDAIQTLEVIAHSAPGPLRADIAIDSFFLGDPGTNPDNPDDPVDPPTAGIPSPGTLLLLGLGLLGLYSSRRK